MGLTRIYKFCLPNTKWIPNYFIAFSELFYRPLILHLSPCGNFCALLNSTYPSTKHNKYHMGTLQFPDSHFCTQVSGFQVSQFCHNSALVFKHSSWDSSSNGVLGNELHVKNLVQQGAARRRESSNSAH